MRAGPADVHATPQKMTPTGLWLDLPALPAGTTSTLSASRTRLKPSQHRRMSNVKQNHCFGRTPLPGNTGRAGNITKGTKSRWLTPAVAPQKSSFNGWTGAYRREAPWRLPRAWSAEPVW
jgi:hypothetical protein